MKDKKTEYLNQKYQEMKKRGETWELKKLRSPSRAHVNVEGKKVIMLASNNYLDLANDSRLKQAAQNAINRFGVGAGSDWSIAGYMQIQEELHNKIADFKETESGLAYQTGFAVNSGLIPQLLGKDDVFISDELNHGSIIDGIRLSEADKLVYEHSNMSDLEDKLKEAQDKYDKKIVLTDGVFSMDGDIAKMDEIQKLAEEYGAMTYVDDAHGEGVLGEGHGIASEFNLGNRIDFQVGTFSKAFGSFGGMLAADEPVVNYAYNTSRTWLLSAAFPPAVAAANKKALEIVEDEKKRVDQLWEKRDYFKEEMESIGFDNGMSETPIVPAMVGDSKKAQKLANRLYDEGIFALAIVFPMVERGKARIRNQLNVGLSDEDINKALRVYEKVGKELDLL